MKQPSETQLVRAGLWPDFHGLFIFTLRTTLSAELAPRYSAVVDERTYVTVEGIGPRVVLPDVAVIEGEKNPASPSQASAPANVAVAVPIERTVPLPHEVRERFVTLQTDAGELVAVIELLSLSNKRSGDRGRELYLQKRSQVLESRVHLIEIDLLEDGERMPVAEGWPPCGRSILVARENRRPIVEIYPVARGERLPVIRLPLRRPDADHVLDVQAIFDRTWQQGGYDRLLGQIVARQSGQDRSE